MTQGDDQGLEQGVEAAVACGLSSAFPEQCEPAQDDCPGGRCGSGWTVFVEFTA